VGKKPDVDGKKTDAHSKGPEVENTEPEVDGIKPEVENRKPEVDDKEPEVKGTKPDVEQAGPVGRCSLIRPYKGILLAVLSALLMTTYTTMIKLLQQMDSMQVSLLDEP
jgi:hypothetical protein